MKDLKMIMTKTGVVVGVDERLVEQAIKCEWDSMNFVSNSVFAKVMDEDMIVIFETTGSVAIIDLEEDRKYVGAEVLENKKISSLIRTAEIYNHDRYMVDFNNWFAFVYFRKYEGEYKSVDDWLEDPTSETVEEFAEFVAEVYLKISKSENKIKELI